MDTERENTEAVENEVKETESEFTPDVQAAIDKYNKENNGEDTDLPADETSGEKDTEPSDIDNQEEGDSETDSESSEESFDEALLDRAKINGLSEDEVKSFPTSEALTRALDLFEKKWADKPAIPKADDDTPEPENPPEFKLELDPETLDEEQITKALAGINEHFNKELNAVKSELAQYKEREIQLRHAAIVNSFEKMIDDMGDEYSEYLGKGPQTKINRLQLDTRSKIFDTMGALESSFVKQGKALSEKQLFDMACRVELGDKIETLARKKIKDEVLKRKDSAILPPSAKGSGGKAAKSELDKIQDIINNPDYEYKGS